jgi:putative Se/S carrier protein
MSNKCYIVFPSNSLAMQANRIAKKNSISVKLTTIPRKIAHECNLGLKISSENMELFKQLLKEHEIECSFVLVD